MLVNVLCIENLHPYQVDSGAEETICPECGCQYVRRQRVTPQVPMAVTGSEVTVVVDKVRRSVGGETWLDTPDLFRKAAGKLAPELIGTDDLKKGVERWFKEDSHGK